MLKKISLGLLPKVLIAIVLGIVLGNWMPHWGIRIFVTFNDIFSHLDESFYLGHHFYNREYCECVDGVYLTNNDKMVELYARMVKDCECPYTTQLVYTSDNKVTAGFGKKLLYK